MMDNSIKVLNEMRIILPDYPGFVLIVPNESNVFTINKVVSLFMDWTGETIKNIPPNKQINLSPPKDLGRLF